MVAPSQPPRLRFRSFCTRLSCRERRLILYPFTHLWVFTLFYPISARLPSNLLKIRDNSSSLPQLGRDTYSTVVSEATFQKYRELLYPIVVSEATFQKYRELPYLPTELSTPSSKTYNLGDDLGWLIIPHTHEHPHFHERRVYYHYNAETTRTRLPDQHYMDPMRASVGGAPTLPVRYLIPPGTRKFSTIRS